MDAGRDMDALVAEKVMGWNNIEGGHGHPTESGPFVDCGCLSHAYQKQEIPHYSTDIAAAWEVVEKMMDEGEYTSLECYGGRYCFHIHLTADTDDIHIEVAETAPLAICSAALAAKGVSV